MKVDSIQKIRAIAAIMVVVDHSLNQFSKFRDYTGINGHVITNARCLGDVGVMMFFIVSGWIMMLTTYKKEWNRGLSKVFLIKRFVRVIPLYWIYLSLLVVLYFLNVAFKNGHYSYLKILMSYLLIPYKENIHDAINPMLPQAWTLIYEMFYYIIFSILIFFSLKKESILITFSLYTVALVLSFIFSDDRSSFMVFFGNPIVYLFVLGMCIYKYKITGDYNKLIKSCFFISSIFGFILLFFITGDDKFIELALTFFTAITLFLFLLNSKVQNKVIVFLGDASYSIYLAHIFFTLMLGSILKKTDQFFLFDLILFLFTILLSVVFGCVMYLFLEKRLISFLMGKVLR